MFNNNYNSDSPVCSAPVICAYSAPGSQSGSLGSKLDSMDKTVGGAKRLCDGRRGKRGSREIV